MIEQFFNIQSITFGILKILLVAGIGYLLFQFKILNDILLKWLNKILMFVCLPALIFSKIAFGFSASLIDFWWLMPLLAFCFTFLGGAIGWMAQKKFSRFKAQKEFITSCAFQNCGYLPLTLTSFVCSGDACNIIFIYIFLYLIGFNMLFWGFMPAYLSKSGSRGIKIFDILNPPFVITFIAIVVALTRYDSAVLNAVRVPLEHIGALTFYIATIILGAFLAKHKGHIPESWRITSSVVLIKLVLIPLCVIVILKFVPFSDYLKFFIFLEAIMPTAISLVIVGNYAGANNKFFGGVILYSHAIAIFTIPVWLLIFQMLF